MATFAPPVQVQDDFKAGVGWTKPTSQPGGNEAMKNLFTGLGTVLDEGVTAAHNVIKENLDANVSDFVDQQRNTVTAQLAQTKSPSVNQSMEPDGTNLPLSFGPTEGPSILGSTKNLPPELTDAKVKADALVSARDNGTISLTQYRANINTYAKYLRSEYPGFRKEIDQSFSEAGAGNPANEELRARVQDFNAARAGKDNIKNKAITELLNRKDPNSVALAQAVHDGKLDPFKALSIDATNYAWETQDKKTQAQKRQEDWDVETTKRAATEDATFTVGKTVGQTFNTAWGISGMDDPKNTGKFLSDQAAGNISKMSPEEASQHALVWQQKSLEMEAALDYQLNTPQQKYDGKSYAQILGPEETQKIKSAQMTTFNHVSDALGVKDFRGADYWKNLNEMNLNRDVYRMTHDVSVGGMSRVAQSMNRIYGPQGMAVMLPQTIIAEKDKALANYAQTVSQELATNQSGSDNPNAPPPSLTGSVDEAAKLKAPPRTVKSFIDTIGKATQPGVSDEGKMSLLKSGFGPGNEDLWNPKRWATNQDQLDAFHYLTSPGMSREVSRLARTSADGATMARTYADQVDKGFRTLYQRELNDINDFRIDTANAKIIWNDKTSEFSAAYQGALIDNTTKNYRDTIDRTLRRVNDGLHNVATARKELGGEENVNAYLVQMMQGQGIDVRGTQEHPNIFQRMFEAVKNNSIGEAIRKRNEEIEREKERKSKGQ